MAVAGDVLVKLDMHQAVFFQRVHLARLGLARLKEPQWLGNGHLIDQDLPFFERLFPGSGAGSG